MRGLGSSAWDPGSGFSRLTWQTGRGWKAFSATAISKPWFIWRRRPGYGAHITSPDEYVASNLVGFVNVLEGVRACSCRHFVFASSSSVYGSHNKIPFAEEDSTDYPVSLYAATKKSNEVVAHAYSHLFHIPTTGLRFFTVYGPWGRPDMAVFKFVDAIMGGRAIELYNFGRLRRDFTFVDDIVEGIVRVLPLPPKQDGAEGVSEKLRCVSAISETNGPSSYSTWFAPSNPAWADRRTSASCPCSRATSTKPRPVSRS